MGTLASHCCKEVEFCNRISSGQPEPAEDSHSKSPNMTVDKDAALVTFINENWVGTVLQRSVSENPWVGFPAFHRKSLPPSLLL